MKTLEKIKIDHTKKLIIADWIRDAEFALQMKEKGESNSDETTSSMAKSWGGPFTCLPNDVTYCDVEEEIIPALKKDLEKDLDEPENEPICSIKVKCDNCDRVYESAEDLRNAWPDIPLLSMRIDPGGEVPAGECNDCGALVYIVK